MKKKLIFCFFFTIATLDAARPAIGDLKTFESIDVVVVADVDVDDDDSFRQQSRQKKRLKMIQLWLDQWEEGVHYTSLSLSHSHSFSLYLCHPKNV